MAANSYATATVLWYDGLGRTVATADFGREDVDSGLTHYVFDGTSGDVIDQDENGLPDVAEDAPPEPYPQDPNSLAGIDFQLQLTEYDAAGRALRPAIGGRADWLAHPRNRGSAIWPTSEHHPEVASSGDESRFQHPASTCPPAASGSAQ